MRPRSHSDRHSDRRLGAWCRSLACGLLLAGGCYDGPGTLEPEPGTPGGLCLEPEGACDEVAWICESVGRFCYDVTAPCRGVLCGGHGTCSVGAETGLPACECEPGYNNLEYSLICAESL